MGRVNQTSGNNREAVLSYRAALAQTPKPEFEGDVLYLLGEALYKVPELDTADDSIKILEDALSKPRKYVAIWEIHNTKGHALSQKERFLEALKEFDKALSEGTEQMDTPGNVFNNKAACLEGLGRTKEAIHLYQETLTHYRSRKDTKGYAAYRLGVLYKITDLNLSKRYLRSAKGFFEHAKQSGQVPEWYADNHLSNIVKELNEFDRDIEIESSKPENPAFNISPENILMFINSNDLQFQQDNKSGNQDKKENENKKSNRLILVIGIIGLIIAILTCIGGYLALPQVQLWISHYIFN